MPTAFSEIFLTKRIAIIGATGHIGSWLVPRLVDAGHEVTAVTRGNREPYHVSDAWSDVATVRIDRTSAERDGSFGSAIAALDADIVVDLVCFNPDSARHLVDALRDRIELFIHCGTLWVHGNPPHRPYDETVPRKPFGQYGILKAEIERLLLDESARGFPASVLHPGHITGPGWPPINPAGNLDLAVFDRLATGESVALPGDGSATLQHVHADDVAQAFALTIERPHQAIGEAFHVAARFPITMGDYARGAADWSGREANSVYMEWEEWRQTVSSRDAELTRDHMMHSPHASIAKAERLLGFVPRYSALDAAREAYESVRVGGG